MSWKPSLPHHVSLVALVISTALLLPGCGNDGSETSTPTQSPTGTPSRTSTPPSSAPPTPSPAQPDAADGRDLDACRDGTCEVEVQPGDVIQFEGEPAVGSLTMLSITPDRLTVVLPSGFTTSVNGSVTINDAIRVETVNLDEDLAVLNISPSG